MRYNTEKRAYQMARLVLHSLGVSLLLTTTLGFILAGCTDDSSTDTSQRSLCEQTCALNFCANDLPSDQCIAACDSNMKICPVEFKAAIECRIGVGQTALACSSDGVTYVEDATLCGDEATVAINCLANK
jgi:hypothetical protein